MYEGQIITGSFFVPRGDASVVFDAVHETFDEIAGFVGPFVEASASQAIAARWNDRLGPALLNAFHQLVRVVAFVGNHGVGQVLAQQFFGTLDVVLFTGSQAQLQRLALGIYGNVQFATKSAARATERFFARLFFWEPAAC